MKILLTGANGQIGTELTRLLGAQNECVLTATTKSELDICNAAQIAAAIDTHTPDIVINAAAFTAVDAAESQQDLAFAVNAAGPELLADACQQAHCRLLHLSTDFVFAGDQTSAYTEDAPVGPLSVYGHSKAAGEAAVRARCTRHVILRTAWVYSPWGNNFMKTMLRLMASGQPLNVVGDQHGSPTAAADIAAAIAVVCTQLDSTAEPAYGTYHYTGRGATSWFCFASHIAKLYRELTGKTVTLNEISTTGYPTPAQRPGNSVLNCDRIQDIFGITTVNWESAVSREIRRYWKMQSTGEAQ